MRRAASLGLVFLAVGAGFLLWSRRDPPAPRAPRRPATEAHDSSHPEKPRSAAPDGPPAPPDPADKARTGEVQLRGTLVVDDERGPVLTGQSGTMRLHVDAEPSREGLEIEITAGAWQATVPAEASLSFTDILLLGGRCAFCDDKIDVPLDGVVEVRCRLYVPTRLRVIDEEGHDLDDIEIVEMEDPDIDFEIRPDATCETLLAGVFSPVELRGVEGIHGYWVRARDHAWSRIALSLGGGGERVVRLARAGVLDVRLSPFDAGSDVTLNLSREDRGWFSCEPDASGRARIDGLPPGRYELHAAVGRWSKEERVLAKAYLWIEPGVTKEVRLSLREAAPPADWVPLAGTLMVDAAWPKEESVSITVESVGMIPDRVAEVRPHDSRWSAGRVPVGRYALTVEPWTWVQIVEVGPQGNTDVRLDVPPPCDVEVRIVEPEAGHPVTEAHGWWYMKGAATALHSLEPGAGQLLRFRAPLGTVVVGIRSDLVSARREVELRPGINRVDLQAVWRLSVDFVFKDGTMTVPVDNGFRDGIEASALDDGYSLGRQIGDPGGARVTFTKRGRYRVSFPEIEGYEPIAPVEVDVAPGRIPRIEVPLKRRER